MNQICIREIEVEWISMKDRAPEIDQWCMVKYPKGSEFEAQYMGDGIFFLIGFYGDTEDKDAQVEFWRELNAAE